jgi:hypothetical protein
MKKNRYTEEQIIRIAEADWSPEAPIPSSASEQLFRELAEFFVLSSRFLDGAEPVSAFLETLMQRYPESEQGLSLKKKVLEEIANASELPTLFGMLESGPASQSFAGLTEGLSSVASDLAQGQTDQGLTLAEHFFVLRDRNSVQEAIFTALLRALNVVELQDFRPIRPQLLIELARRKHEVIRLQPSGFSKPM